MSTLVTTNLKNPSNPGNNLVLEANGSVLFSAGTATVPSISFTGDLNTGIYSPGADQVAISTGGSGRLFVDASGRVGVGSAPSVGNGIHATINTNNYGTALVLQNANVNGWAAEMQFLGITTTDTQAKIGALATGPGTNSGALAFYTANAGSYLERLRITSAGLVGIGTSSPSGLLHVAGQIYSSGTGYTGTNSPTLRLINSTATTGRTFGINSADSGIFQVFDASAGDATRLCVDSSGRVGIDTTSPSTTLSIGAFSSSSFNGGVCLNRGPSAYNFYEASDGTNSVIFGLDNNLTVAKIGSVNSYPIGFFTGNAERARIDSSGRLLVGTSTTNTNANTKIVSQLNAAPRSSGGPEAALFLATASSGYALAMGAYDSGSVSSSYTWISSVRSQDSFYDSAAIAPLSFRIADREALRIDSQLRLLVGTSSSSAEAKFIVQGGNTGSGGGMNIQRSVTTASAGSTIGFINFTDSSNNVGATVIAEGDGTWSAGTSHPTRLAFSTTANGASSPTERLRITSAGLVGVGTSSPLTKLDVRSGVITAGSTSSPSGTEILRGYYSDTDGALAVIGTEYSSGGTVIGSAVKPSTSTSGAFLSSTTINITRGAYTIAGNTHKWYIGAVQTVAENSSVSTSEVMRIDSSGRLLVGTSSARSNFYNTSATANIQIETAASDSALSVVGNSTAGFAPAIILGLSNSNTLGSNTLVANAQELGRLVFQGNDGTEFVQAAQIQAFVDGTPGANDIPGRLVFSTTADGASSPTERMRITNNGKIGIANDGVIQQGSGIGGGSAAGILELYNGGTGNTTLENTGAFPILFKTNGSERARIDSSGRFGIGTSSPQVNLDVRGTINAGNGTTRYALLYTDTDGAVLGTAGLNHPWIFKVGNGTSDIERVRIDGSGRLLVGTSTGSYKFQINALGSGGFAFDDVSGTISNTFGTGGNLVLRAQVASSSGGGEIYLGGSTRGDSNINSIVLSTANTERMRIDSSGRVGIGTTSPGNANTTQVSSDGDGIRVQYANTPTGAVGPRLIFGHNTNNGTQQIFSAIKSLMASGNDADWSSHLGFYTGGSSLTERIRIPAQGGLSVGSSVSPNALTQSTGIRLGESTIASHTFTNVTTSPVTIANGVGIGGLAFVQAYNTGNGAQYTGLVMWRSGVVAVVFESNSLGFGLTYSVSGSTLLLQTASGTITGSVITFAS